MPKLSISKGLAAKFFVSAGLLYWLLSGTNFSEIVTSLRNANYGLLAIAFLLHPVGLLISALRWKLLLTIRGSTPRLRFLVESYFVGMFFNNFLPSTIGGDVYRAYDSWRLGQSKSSAFAIVFIDRMLGVLALAIFAVCALLIDDRFTKSVPHLWLWISLVTLGLILVVYLIFFTPDFLLNFFRKKKFFSGRVLGKKIDSIIDAFLAFRGQRLTLFQAMGLSVLLQINVVIHFVLIGFAMGLSVPLSGYFLIIPLVTIILMLPVSINGVGIRESSFAIFLAGYGVVKSDAIAFAWIGFIMVLIQSILGGILYALRSDLPKENSPNNPS